MTKWVKNRLMILCLFFVTPVMVIGCESVDVLTDATAVQLETSMISMMNTAVSYVFYNLFKLPLTNLAS